MIFTYCLGIFMFFVQHNFEQSYYYSNSNENIPYENFKKAALEGSSCFLLPGVLRWFMANSGYHHIHHISPRIPFYKLKKIYDSHPELRQAYVVTLKTALKQFSYKLYYPEWNKMITWKEYGMLESCLLNVDASL